MQIAVAVGVASGAFAFLNDATPPETPNSNWRR
jgi:hypothetical protein